MFNYFVEQSEREQRTMNKPRPASCTTLLPQRQLYIVYTTLFFPTHVYTCSYMLLVVLTMSSCFSSQSKCFRFLRDTEKLDETKETQLGKKGS